MVDSTSATPKPEPKPVMCDVCHESVGTHMSSDGLSTCGDCFCPHLVELHKTQRSRDDAYVLYLVAMSARRSAVQIRRGLSAIEGSVDDVGHTVDSRSR